MAELILASSIVMVIFLLVMALIYFLFSKKGMTKQKEHFKQLHKALKPGVKVQLANGIYGTLKNVTEETVDLEVKSGAVIEVSRYAISEIIK